MSSSSSTSTHFFVGLDLGQSSDYAAISILQKSEKPESGSIYRVRHLERPALNTPYPQIVNRVAFIMNSIELADRGTLVVDQTGIGAPVFDMFVKAGLDPVGIYIHGGDSTSSQDGRTWRVPKRDLVGVLQVLLQSGRLKIATKLELGSILEAEMLNFKVKIDPATAHDSYSAWRENQHDDLALPRHNKRLGPRIKRAQKLRSISPRSKCHRVDGMTRSKTGTASD